MKRLFVVLFFSSLFLLSFAVDYSKIDNQSLTIPKELKTPDDIATYLTRNLSQPIEKARAIYFWIAHNIRYDLELLKSNKKYIDRKEIVEEVLLNRQGVCQHYAELFHACCASVGVKSYVINGYTNQKGELAKYGHAWNAITVDDKYYEIDVTWAAGFLEKGKYVHQFTDRFFLLSPASFIKTHIPYDPIWQFSNNPISHFEFEKQDFSKLTKSSTLNFQDSIKIQTTLKTIDRLVLENKRIAASGICTQTLRVYVAQNQQKIINEKYNLAVGSYNLAVETYNTYVLSKNRQFDGTTKPVDEILSFLTLSHNQIEKGESLLRFLSSDNANLNKLIEGLQTSISDLNSKLDNEDRFMKKYVATWRPFRFFLFYTL
jgi:hypothetical protein